MTDRQKAEQTTQQTLETLDQLSQTLEVMSCVVERLRLHMTKQLSHTAEAFQDERKLLQVRQEEVQRGTRQLKQAQQKQQDTLVEISRAELEEGVDPVVH